MSEPIFAYDANARDVIAERGTVRLTPTQARLFEMLLRRPRPTSALAALLWPESARDKAMKEVNQIVFQIRRRLRPVGLDLAFTPKRMIGVPLRIVGTCVSYRQAIGYDEIAELSDRIRVPQSAQRHGVRAYDDERLVLSDVA